jgi:hypothetical protein
MEISRMIAGKMAHSGMILRSMTLSDSQLNEIKQKDTHPNDHQENDN